MFYLVCYVLIGGAAGLLAKRLMPGKVPEGHAALAALGAAGAVAGGLAALALLMYGRSVVRDYWWIDAGGAGGGTALPAYWLTFFTSAAGALLALAGRKLMAMKKNRT